MERKTYAGHGKPDTFTYYGLEKDPTQPGTLCVVGYQGKEMWVCSVAGEVRLEKITGNTKFWAEPGKTDEEPTSGDVVKSLRKRLDWVQAQAEESAAGFEAQRAAMVSLHDEEVGKLQERVAELEYLIQGSTTGTVPTAALVSTEGMAEMVSLPVAELDRIMDEMDQGRTQAAGKAESIRTNRKASYSDRLHKEFLDGVAKTSAYYLRQLSAVVDPQPKEVTVNPA